jgi:tRNA pseudouridine32 synthase / 23S rRNA pseudouridine746 synthase
MTPPSASTVQLPPGPWTTVLDGLCARFPAIDRAQWLDRMARGRVLDEAGRPIDAAAPYRVGLHVRYYREVIAEPAIPFAESVLHADEHLLVVDKPHFLPVTPAGGFVQETLLARLVRRFDNPQLVPLHRIDRATAGLVLFSVNPATRGAYQALFRDRRIVKRYEAWAPALPQHAFPLVRHSRLQAGEPFFRMHEVAGEANSETRVEVLERGAAHWRYALHPHTGRKHQLRVHMAALGAPILNDRWYPLVQPEAGDDHARPLKLLAQALGFVDPLSGATREFHSARTL